MKNKKGFTLVELLAVIVLLSIVGVIGVTTILRRTRESKEKAMFVAAQDIVSIAEAYIEKKGGNDASVREMVDSKLLDSNVSNPRTIKDKDKGFWEENETEKEIDKTRVEKCDTCTRQTDYKVLTTNASNECYYKFDGYIYYFQKKYCDSLNPKSE